MDLLEAEETVPHGLELKNAESGTCDGGLDIVVVALKKMKEHVLSVAFAVLSVAGYRRVSAGSLHAAMRICLQAPFPHR